MSCVREMCAICGHVSRVGFWVPDEVWKHAIHPHYHNAIVCLSCFTERADEHMIEWDAKIKLYPVSMVTHLQNTDPTRTLADIERDAVSLRLAQHNGNRADTALSLGIPERTLYRKLKLHGLR
jgi:DNA-binding NtrC family response regulator